MAAPLNGTGPFHSRAPFLQKAGEINPSSRYGAIRCLYARNPGITFTQDAVMGLCREEARRFDALRLDSRATHTDRLALLQRYARGEFVIFDREAAGRLFDDIQEQFSRMGGESGQCAVFALSAQQALFAQIQEFPDQTNGRSNGTGALLQPAEPPAVSPPPPVTVVAAPPLNRGVSASGAPAARSAANDPTLILRGPDPNAPAPLPMINTLDPLDRSLGLAGCDEGGLERDFGSVRGVAFSRKGRKRATPSVNEDSLGWARIAAADGTYVTEFLLVDGMGGHAAGDTASREAVQAYFTARRRGYPRVEAFKFANDWLVRAGKKDAGIQRGATLVSVSIDANGRADIFYLGDPRFYVLTDDGPQLWTLDHSIVMRRVKRAFKEQGRPEISVPVEIGTHILIDEQIPVEIRAAHRNDLDIAGMVMFALGTSNSLEYALDKQTPPVQLRPGQRFVLCVDGVWKETPNFISWLDRFSRWWIFKIKTGNIGMKLMSAVLRLLTRHSTDDNSFIFGQYQPR